MDESIYVMESGPSASPSQKSTGSVASADGSDSLEDQYCMEAVGKREAAASRSSLGLDEETGTESLIFAKGPAGDAKGDAKNSAGKRVFGGDNCRRLTCRADRLREVDIWYRGYR